MLIMFSDKSLDMASLHLLCHCLSLNPSQRQSSYTAPPLSLRAVLFSRDFPSFSHPAAYCTHSPGDLRKFFLVLFLQPQRYVFLVFSMVLRTHLVVTVFERFQTFISLCWIIQHSSVRLAHSNVYWKSNPDYFNTNLHLLLSFNSLSIATMIFANSLLSSYLENILSTSIS